MIVVEHLPPSLSLSQRELLSSLTRRLGAIPRITAVALGGSHAYGRARPGSDIDLYLFYAEATPCSIADIRELAETVNDVPGPVVTDFYEWGPWVNGGTWLTIGGQRVDFVYRSLDHVARVIADAYAGRYEQHYAQQPPFGFFSGAYLGEIAACIPLLDAEQRIADLKEQVATYPEALRNTVVQDYLWQVELALTAFAPRFAERAGAYGAAACITRIVNQLLLALFALNRRYFTDDKTALSEAAAFELAPRDFEARVQRMLANPGESREQLGSALETSAQLFREIVELTAGSYKPRFEFPGAR